MGQGECVAAKHAPDTELGKRDTSAGAHTANCKAICRHSPKVGAVCLNWASTVLCGGRPVMCVPTAMEHRIGDKRILRLIQKWLIVLLVIIFTLSRLQDRMSEG